MKAPSPLIILVFAIACIYRGFVAFFPSLRGENRKNRKPIPQTHGVLYFLIGTFLFLYSVYVIYVFIGGSYRILPIKDRILFRSADLFLLTPFILGALVSIFNSIKKK